MPECKFEFRVPKKGDRLFRESQDIDSGVDFPVDDTSRHVFIWDGYMRAGDLLITACGENNHQRHFLVYPILFNYRHAIELAIKWVIVRYRRYSSFQIEDDELDSHKLWPLWMLCKKIIIELGSESEEISYVEQLIKDFHDVDKTAQAFRYPIDKSGTVFMLPNKIIDLQHIRDVMKGLASFFDGLDGQLDAHVSASDWYSQRDSSDC